MRAAFNVTAIHQKSDIIIINIIPMKNALRGGIRPRYLQLRPLQIRTSSIGVVARDDDVAYYYTLGNRE